MKKFIFFLFFLASVSFGFSQRNNITGTVRAAKDSSTLQSVSVIIKGTKRGTTTNASGNFSLSAEKNVTLVFSAIGYSSEEIAVNGQQEINVYLRTGAGSNQLNDVIVVGYGTRRKIDITGAVDQISGSKISERPVANVLEGLQGLSPGLNISYSSGTPGSTPNIDIRGMGSINGGSPLIIIDGIASQTDDLLRLNPADIESYSILKDGASAAIYGARSAFGVIMITTKKGRLGGNQTISYNNYFAFSRPTNLSVPITDPYIAKSVKYLASVNAGYPGYNPSAFASSDFPAWMQQWAKDKSDNPNSTPSVMVNPTDATLWAYMGNYNPVNYFWNRYSFSQYHNVSISGSSTGPKPITYLLSADYTNDNGIIKIAKNEWNRYGLRANIGINPLSWLNVQNNFSVYQLVSDMPSYGTASYYNLSSQDVPVNPDGTWAYNYGGYTAAGMENGGRSVDTRFGFTNNLRAVGSFLNNDLTITGTLSYKRELWKNNLDYLPFNLGVGPDNVQLQNAPGSVSVTNGTVRTDIYDLYANYNKKFGDHSIKLTAGYNQEYYQWDPYTVTRNQTITSSLPYIGLTIGTNPVITQSGYGDTYFDYAVRSYFGRAEYSFKDRYIATFTVREDGSSRFPPQDRWAFTPGVSGAWVVNKENFWNNINSTISTFKLRASYANQGNQGLPNTVQGAYGYIQTLSTNTTSYLINGGLPTVVSGAPLLNVNPDNYTWEKVATTNFGTDIGLVKDHLNLSFDYYTRITTGMLAPASVLPGALGTSAPQQNSANMSTKGWELSLSYNTSFPVAGKPFSFNAKVLLWDNKSKITKYNNPGGQFSGAWRQGQNVGEIWGLVSDGYFKTDADIAALDESAISPYGDPIIAGWPKFKDLNKDDKIVAGNSTSDPQDLKIIGNRSPRYSYSFNLNLSWNNIDLSVFLQGVAKADYYPAQYPFWGVMQDPYGPIYPWSLDYYRATAADPSLLSSYPKAYIAAGLANANLNSKYPVMQMWEADARTGVGLSLPTTQYLMSAAYLRIKNLTLGYTLPTGIINKAGFTRLRIFFSGENMFDFSGLKKYGIDPEAAIAQNVLIYPFQKKYSMGINLTF